MRRLHTRDFRTIGKPEVIRRMKEISGRGGGRPAPMRLCRPYLQLALDAVTELLVEADPEVRISLQPLGTFEVGLKAEHKTARVPHTNEPVYIPARRKAYFRAHSRLTKAMMTPLTELGYTWTG